MNAIKEIHNENMDLSYDDVQQILKIINSSSIEELHLELGDLKLIIRKKGGTASVEHPSDVVLNHAGERTRPAEPVAVWPEGGAEPVAVPATKKASAVSGQSAPRSSRQGGHEVKAPMVGSFYRASKPGATPFVEVGSVVTEDHTVCIIEVMKLMNSIKAGCRGRVVDICAGDGTLVEFGQTLMVIEPLP